MGRVEMAVIRALTDCDKLSASSLSVFIDASIKEIESFLDELVSRGYAAKLDYNQYTLTR